MNQFTSKYADCLRGVLSGFDRLVFRGCLRTLTSAQGMMGYLTYCNLRLDDFAEHAQKVTERIKEAVLLPFQQANRPVRYLPSAHTSKENLARQIAQQDGITQGLVCMFTCLESGQSVEVYRGKQTQNLRLVSRPRKRLHLYAYQIHPVFGFMNIRLQTWFPFAVQVCLNGREWLARQMDQEGIAYQRQDNCFPWVEDVQRVQALQEAQLRKDWPTLLEELATTQNPVLEEILAPFVARYYWTCHQSEWATDLLFTDDALLKRLYPRFVQHGMTNLSSPDVLRFLGKPLTARGEPPTAFTGEVTTDIKRREEGVRIKHRVKHNAIKAYDKAHTPTGSVLRIETTLNDPTDLKVFRPIEGGAEEKLAWRPMRKGVADMHRRASVCQKANERCLEALSSVDTCHTLQELTGQIGCPTTFNAKRVRGINPFAAEDAALLEAVSRGEFTFNGLRNRDLQRLLYPTQAATQEEARKRSGKVTRQLRLLRAHGILAKVPHTHRYQVTERGRLFLTAILTARQTPVNQLLAKAA